MRTLPVSTLAALLCVVSATNSCTKMLSPARGSCECNSGWEVICRDLNATTAFGQHLRDVIANEIKNKTDVSTRAVLDSVRSIRIDGSSLNTLDLSDFKAWRDLHSLSVTNSSVRAIKSARLPHLQDLNLSHNLISSSLEALSQLEQLKALNLSMNKLWTIKGLQGLTHLEKVDLSHNVLDESGVTRDMVEELPASVSYLDISSNAWTCSPGLSWIHSWSQPLVSRSVLQRLDSTRCRYSRQNRDAPLLLVSEYYASRVLPHCPFDEGCSCVLTHMQEGSVTHETERVYTVEVGCVHKDLKTFPTLPKNTRALDSVAFSLLDVSEQNYDSVDSLNLDSNVLEELPEKLLDMKLELMFSARNNKLTDIPYDFSQRLMRTKVIELSENPWKCSCSSQITDVNLIALIKDRSEMVCGAGSETALVAKKIAELIPQELCPPESSGEFQELLLQILCFTFAVLIVAILTKLAYDYRVYRTKGQLPWVVLRMP